MMVDQGYDDDFSTAVTITSSCEGLLVPPSHNMVIYATSAGGISVGALFLAGYLPGALLALLNQKGDMLSDKGFGVGILNLLNRLRIHYGEAAQWYFDNRDGAFSEIILPISTPDA